MNKSAIFVFTLLLFSVLLVNAQSTLWSEDFETGWGSWYADNGLWEVGTPTVGPDNTHSGQNCVGTVLGGNYPTYANTRLISPEINLPTLTGDEKIELKFWQWYVFQYGADKGELQISVNSGAWETISNPNFDGTNNIWSQYIANLSAYAGSSIRIAFYFTSDGNTPNQGWYIDDVSLEKKVVVFPNPEDFETGWGSWYADNGLWEVGTPTVGPDNTHSGQNCVGTVLGGNYPTYANTRLISPEINLPTLTGDEKIELKFWQWYVFQYGADKGELQISVNSGAWETISNPNFDGTNNIWSQYIANLSAYAGSSIRIAFYFTSDGNTPNQGWYIDDVSLEKKVVVFPNPEDFETGWGSWYADNGLWEVGTPTVGPDNTHSGQNCVGTVLGGNYPTYANTRLISPEINLPTLTGDEKIELKFWQWYVFQYGADKGELQISVNSGAWETISNPNFDGTNNIWSQYIANLSAYAGSSIRIAFYFTSDGNTPNQGWYIDDVSLEKKVVVFPNPEDFETGWGSWYADNGLWEVGTPTVGPDNTHSGQNCVGTVLGGNYPTYANTRLISPEINLPTLTGDEKIELKFWQWYVFQYGADKGELQISVNSGAWETISNPNFDGTNNIWSQYIANLSAYAGSSIRIAFYFTSDGNTPNQGWYIDDFVIEDNSNLFVSAGPDFTIKPGSSEKINATISGGTQPYSYIWVPGESLDDPTILNPVASPSDTTLYFLKVTDNNGFFRTDKVTVFVNNGSSDETEILSFDLGGVPPQTGDATITTGTQTIEIEVEYGTDVTNLVSIFNLSNGATAKVSGVSQESGVTANDFTNEVTYVITAEDGVTAQDWIVTVAVAPNEETAILSFDLGGIPPQTGDATITSATQTVEIEVEYGTDLTNLTATFSLSDGATAKIGGVSQKSGVTANDYTNAVIFKITAEDVVTIQEWTVSVSVAPNIETAILSFDLGGIPPQTGDATIATATQTVEIEVEYGTDLTNLTATFSLSDGATAKIGGVSQKSGVTANDYTNAVIFKITAEDGVTIQEWTVSVSVAPKIETAILSFDLGGIPPQTGDATIATATQTIEIEVEYGTDVTALVASFTLSGRATAMVGSVSQESGVTANDYTNAVIFKITAEDGVTIQEWTVSVSVTPKIETAILSFDLGGIPPQTGDATIATATQTIEIEVEYGTDLTNLTATFSLSDGASAKVGSIVQESGITENDFTNEVTYAITAEDGETVQEWVVAVVAAPNNETDILSYDIEMLPQVGDVPLDTEEQKIMIAVRYGEKITDLIATFALSDGATAKVGDVVQKSGISSNDFTNPVSYVITAEDGVSTQEWTVIIDIITGLDDSILTNVSLSIYPIPTSDNVNIDIRRDGRAYTAEVSIFNDLGQVVAKLEKTNSEDNEIHLAWDGTDMSRSKLPSGIYIAQIKLENSIIVKKLIIQ